MKRTCWVAGSLVWLVAACGGTGENDPPGDAPGNPEELDVDGDGVVAKLDCDDHDAAVYPGAPELCDFKPNGCAAAVSEAGMVAFLPKTGAPRDVTALVKAGTMGAPAALDLNEGGTLNLCAGTFFVSVSSEATSLTVRGAGVNETVLSGGNVARVITMVPDAATLDVSGITLQEGSSDGGAAIIGDGTLTLASAALLGNRADAVAPSGWGGAVFWSGTATVRDTVFRNNIAATAGGALGVDGSLTLRNSEFTSNTSKAGGAVAAINGAVTIETVMLNDNRAIQQGGAVFLQDATSTLRGLSMLRNNATVLPPETSTAFGGGVMLVAGHALIEDCTIKSGRSSIGGGALMVTGGDVVVKRSTFEANESLHFNGTVPSVFSGFGGAIEIVDSKVRIEDSNVTQNQGRWGFGVFVEHGTAPASVDVDIVNTTFSGNRNILGEASSSDLEYWRANLMQRMTLSGAVSIHCDNLGCAAVP